MRIQDLEDQQSIAAVERYANMVDRIRGTEARIMARAEQILGRQAGGAVSAPRALAPVDLPELFLAERMIGDTDDIVSIEFLEAGLIAKRPVGKIHDGGGSFGTGFLVGLDLMITAAHCLPTEADASTHMLYLDDEDDELGEASSTRKYSLDPAKFYLRDDDFDVVIVGVTDFSGLNPPLATYGWHVLVPGEENISPPEPVSIIQHPKGEPKRLVVHNSRFVHRENNTPDERFCWYTGDTQEGSSGAPVFNPDWEVVALHHRAIPHTNAAGEILGKTGEPVILSGRGVTSLDELSRFADVAFIANQGVRASRIHEMVANSVMVDPEMEVIRQQLVAAWAAPGAWRIAQAAAGKGGQATS